MGPKKIIEIRVIAMHDAEPSSVVFEKFEALHDYTLDE